MQKALSSRPEGNGTYNQGYTQTNLPPCRPNNVKKKYD